MKPMAKRKSSGRPTIHDVARHAGVSSITVSRALRTPARVSEKLRERIEVSIKVLDYIPDPKARALASGQNNVIGVLIPSLSNIVFADILRGAQDAVEGTDYQIQIGNMRYSPDKEHRLISLFLAQHPAALIVTGADQSETSRRLLTESGLPVVQIMDIASDPVDMMVGLSHDLAGEAAVDHLVANGYARIGFIGARTDSRVLKRLEGFRRALRRYGMYSPEREATARLTSSVGLGRSLMRELLKADPDTDAVFCVNDDLALGALFECQAHGLAVPGRMGIIGFNDLEMMSAAEPGLTSIRTKRYEMGRLAAEMVMSRLRGGGSEQRIVDLGFELVARNSTRRALHGQESAPRRRPVERAEIGG